MNTFEVNLITQLTRIADALERHPKMNPELGRAIVGYLTNNPALGPVQEVKTNDR